MGRITEIDTLRGIAIILMIIYHFFFDLTYFGIAEINLFSLEWVFFQRLVGVLFLLVVGISLTLSESKNKEGHKRHAKRALKLGAVALLITIATWIYPHDGFIMFGIIHFIAVSTLVAPLFFRFRVWNILLGAMIIFAGFYTASIYTDSKYLFWLGIVYPEYLALDHYSMIPWFGVVLLGIYAGQRFFPSGKPVVKIDSKLLKDLAFLGRYSLLIYLIHQPILVGGMLLYKLMI